MTYSIEQLKRFQNSIPELIAEVERLQALIDDAPGKEGDRMTYTIEQQTSDGLRLAKRVVKYFGDEDIPSWLNRDIEVRDMARALIAKAGGSKTKEKGRKPAKRIK